MTNRQVKLVSLVSVIISVISIIISTISIIKDRAFIYRIQKERKQRQKQLWKQMEEKQKGRKQL